MGGGGSSGGTTGTAPPCDLTGQILVRITGVPPNLTPKVTIQGDHTVTVYATGTVPYNVGFTGLNGVKAEWVEDDDAVVHTVYRPQVLPYQSVCDDTGLIVDVRYTPNPASG